MSYVHTSTQTDDKNVCTFINMVACEQRDTRKGQMTNTHSDCEVSLRTLCVDVHCERVCPHKRPRGVGSCQEFNRLFKRTDVVRDHVIIENALS